MYRSMDAGVRKDLCAIKALNLSEARAPSGRTKAGADAKQSFINSRLSRGLIYSMLISLAV